MPVPVVFSKQERVPPINNASDFVGVTLMQLLWNRVYLGYEKTSWDFRIRSFILGIKNSIYVFNLNYTLIYLKNALNLFFQFSLRKGYCVILNENGYLRPSLKKAFRFYITPYYLETTFFYLIIIRLIRGIFTNNTKTLKKRRLQRLRFFPQLFVFTSPTESRYIINECHVLNIPSICFTDTSYLPVNATYLIPANEKDFHAVQTYITLFLISGVKARMTRTKI